MFRLWDLVAIILFLAGMAGMGLWFARRNTSTEAYFLGNRSFPGWAVGISMLGTSISSVTFLAIPAAAYVLDYRQAVTNLALPFVAVIALIFFIPLFRQGALTSAYEYLEKRFGVLVRSYAALSFLVLQVVRLAMILYLVSIPIEGMLGIPILWIIIVGGAVVSVYTVFGGIEAVIWTDVVQTFILLGGGLLCLGLMVWELPGGFGQVIEIGTEFNKFSLGPLEGGFGERTFFVVLLLGLVNFTNEYAGNQNVVQRYIASKSLREARKATLICMFMSVPTWMSFFFLGSCMFAFYHVFPEPAVAAMAADEVLPHFILTRRAEHLPARLLHHPRRKLRRDHRDRCRARMQLLSDAEHVRLAAAGSGAAGALLLDHDHRERGIVSGRLWRRPFPAEPPESGTADGVDAAARQLRRQPEARLSGNDGIEENRGKRSRGALKMAVRRIYCRSSLIHST